MWDPFQLRQKSLEGVLFCVSNFRGGTEHGTVGENRMENKPFAKVQNLSGVNDDKLRLVDIKYYLGSIAMAEHTIYITQVDANRIRELRRISKYTDYCDNPYLRKLIEELDHAIIVESQNIPSDVITMRSTVCLVDIRTGEEMIYTLVFPVDADLAEGKISVLEPIGADMLGCRVGDTFECDTASGKRPIHIERIIFQPETVGDFN